MQCNDRADYYAKEGARLNQPDELTMLHADCREIVTRVAQDMMVAVICEYRRVNREMAQLAADECQGEFEILEQFEDPDHQEEEDEDPWGDGNCDLAGNTLGVPDPKPHSIARKQSCGKRGSGK